MPFPSMQTPVKKNWRRRSDSKLAETLQQDMPKKKSTKDDLPASPDSLLNGISDYQFLSILGQGKFSKVMLAQHYITQEKFAIKVIDKRAHSDHIMSRLIREIQVMEALHHPNIVHLYETLETENTIYLVMEYVEGMNLEEYLHQQGHKLSEEEARMIFRQMVVTVDYCHRRWVVHRDIKAPNILLTKDKQIRLIDFGLSNRFGLERLQTSCGSMMYYSPEIINHKRYIGPEIDCWCLGICLFRMTAGYEAFRRARDRNELRQHITQRNYTMPAHFSEGLKHTIQKCLSTDRRRRSSLCNALRDDPWLNNHGQLPDLFDSTTNFHSSLYQFALPSTITMDNAFLEARQQERELQQRQYLRDMEEEKRIGYHARKTIFHHAYNPAVYYTAHAYREDKSFLEPRRAALYKDILAVLEQIVLKTANPSLLTSFQDFYRKRPEPNHSLFLLDHDPEYVPVSSTHLPQPSSPTSPTPQPRQPRLKQLLASRPSLTMLNLLASVQAHDPSTTQQPDSRRSSVSTMSSMAMPESPPTPPPITKQHLKKKPSKMNLWLQRSKDKTVYFTMQANVRAISSATLFSLTSSSTAVSTYRDDHQVPVTLVDHEQDELELMLLVRSTCELLGVTYAHASRCQLSCMMNLVEPDPFLATTTDNDSDDLGSWPIQSPGLLKKKKSSHSFHADSTFLGDTILPSTHSTDLLDDTQQNHWWHKPFQRISLPQSLRHSSSMQSLRSLYKPSAISKTSGPDALPSTNIANPTMAAHSSIFFTIDIEALDTKSKSDNRLLALRFSKVSGSVKVYKLVTGWILSTLSHSS